MNGRIYIIKNKSNDKVYIGQTTMSIEDRFKQHLNHSKSKNHYELYQAMDVIGKENFYIESLEENISINKLDDREQYWIETYNSMDNGYNSTPGGRAKHENKILDIDIIIKYLSDGMSVGEISEKLNVHRTTINRALKSNGYKTAVNYRKDGWRSEQSKIIDREPVRELIIQGLSYDEIANKLGIHKKTVCRIAKELNLNKRKMVNYNSVDLEGYQKDYELYKLGLINLYDIENKYGLNQHSHKILKKIINKTNEGQSTNCKAEIDTV